MRSFSASARSWRLALCACAQHIERHIWFLTTTRDLADYDHGLGVLTTAIPDEPPRTAIGRRARTGWHGGVLPRAG